MAPPISLVRNAPPTSIARDASATSSSGYRDVATRFAFDGKNIQNLGDKLTGLQNDLFNSGYYQGSNYGTEVDGKLGPKTNNAIKSLQNDLVSAGFLPQGSATGAFDPAQMGAAISKLMQQGVPDVVSPDIMQRLSRFIQSAGQAPAQMPASTAQSSFTQAAGSNPVALNTPAATPAAAPAADPGEARIQNTLKMLDNIVQQRGIQTADGHAPTQADYQTAVAQVARELAAEPNTPDLLAQLGKGQLGFDPTHNSDSEVDKFLNMIADQVDPKTTAGAAQTSSAATGAPAASGPAAPLSPAGQNLRNLLSNNIDLASSTMNGGNPTLIMNQVIGQRAQSLGSGDIRANLMKNFTAQQLGFDPRTATDAQLQGLVKEVMNDARNQSSLSFSANAPAAAPTASTPVTGTTGATGAPAQPGQLSPAAQNLNMLLGQNIDMQSQLMAGGNPTLIMNQTIAARANSLTTGDIRANLMSHFSAQQLGFDPRTASDAQLKGLMNEVLKNAQSQSQLGFSPTAPTAAPAASTPVTGSTTATAPTTGQPGQLSPAGQNLYTLLTQNINMVNQLMAGGNPTLIQNQVVADRVKSLSSGDIRANLMRNFTAQQLGFDPRSASDAQLAGLVAEVQRSAQSQSQLSFSAT
jgi:hypothetical protein